MKKINSTHQVIIREQKYNQSHIIEFYNNDVCKGSPQVYAEFDPAPCMNLNTVVGREQLRSHIERLQLILRAADIKSIEPDTAWDRQRKG